VRLKIHWQRNPPRCGLLFLLFLQPDISQFFFEFMASFSGPNLSHLHLPESAHAFQKCIRPLFYHGPPCLLDFRPEHINLHLSHGLVERALPELGGTFDRTVLSLRRARPFRAGGLLHRCVFALRLTAFIHGFAFFPIPACFFAIPVAAGNGQEL